MFIFPLVYIISFIITFIDVINGKREGILLFFIFGLSIYTTAMSVTFLLGFKAFIPFLQPLKEILIISVLGLNIISLKKKPRLHLIDYFILAYLTYMLAYALLPIGEYSLSERLLAFKSNSFYILVYFAARFINHKDVYINKYFSYLVILTIAAAAVLMVEVVAQSPLHFHSGYFDYSYYFYNLDADGAYGLKTSFNSDSGYIRFGSFFTNPLEHGGATIIALAVILSLYTRDDNKFRINNISILALIATLLSIIFAISRASLASYCIVIYVYAAITHKKMITKTIQAILGVVAIYVIYLFYQFENNHSGLIMVMLNTINFSDPSSIGHLLSWIEGIISIYEHPLGLGLGSSGRIGATLNVSVGGENQFIILGVQVGLIALTLYLVILVMFIRLSLKSLSVFKGKERKVCMAVFLIKVGLLLSTFTSEVESSTYISYMNWFLSGLFINMLMYVPQPQFKPVNA